jgi:F0F1-type ATP synthase delta subunit
MQPNETQSGGLPVSVITPSNLALLTRELSKLNELLDQAALKNQQVDLKVKDISPSLHEFLQLNKLDVLKGQDRVNAINYLNQVADKAPVVHFSFAVELPPKPAEKLITWLRSNVDPNVLMVIGLAPGIGVGCYVRTTNKVFDFTLRTRLISNKPNLITRIKAVTEAHAPSP